MVCESWYIFAFGNGHDERNCSCRLRGAGAQYTIFVRVVIWIEPEIAGAGVSNRKC